VKRRSGVIGILPSDETIDRLVGALMPETSHEWAAAGRYISLETFARVADKPTVRLPTFAA
jgi:hypothetical protein